MCKTLNFNIKKYISDLLVFFCNFNRQTAKDNSAILIKYYSHHGNSKHLSQF